MLYSKNYIRQIHAFKCVWNYLYCWPSTFHATKHFCPTTNCRFFSPNTINWVNCTHFNYMQSNLNILNKSVHASSQHILVRSNHKQQENGQADKIPVMLIEHTPKIQLLHNRSRGFTVTGQWCLNIHLTHFSCWAKTINQAFSNIDRCYSLKEM